MRASRFVLASLFTVFSLSFSAAAQTVLSPKLEVFRLGGGRRARAFLHKQVPMHLGVCRVS